MTSKPTIRGPRDICACSHHQKNGTRCNALAPGTSMGSNEGFLHPPEDLKKNALANPVFKNVSRRALWL